MKFKVLIVFGAIFATLMLLPSTIDCNITKATFAQGRVGALAIAVEMFESDNRRYPSSLDELDYYLSKPELVKFDPWGVEFHFKTDFVAEDGSRFDWRIWTFGRDNKAGGTGLDQDIYSD